VAPGPGLAATPPVGAAPPGPGLGRRQVQARLAGPRPGAATAPAVRTALVRRRTGPRVGTAVGPGRVVARPTPARIATPVAAGRVVARGVVTRGTVAVGPRRVVAEAAVAPWCVAARVAAPVAARCVVARASPAAVSARRVVARPVGPGPPRCVVARGPGAVALVVAALPGAGLLPRLSRPAGASLTTLPSCPFALPALTCRLLGGVAVAPPVRRRRLGSAQRRSSRSTADGSPATKPRSKDRSNGRATLPSRGRWVRIFATGRLLTCTCSHCLWPALTAA
jgi:hypothetical protein